jgi:HEAT repeat protein
LSRSLLMFSLTLAWFGSALSVLGSAAEVPVPSSKPSPAVTSRAAKPESASPSRKGSLGSVAWETLAAELSNKRTAHRTDALAALATVGSRGDILPLLLGALEDKDATIRKDAVLALGDLKADSAKPQLRKMLDDPSTDVGFAAAGVLAKMGDHSGRDIFIATLQGERKGDGLIKESLKSNVAKYRDPKVIAMVGAREAAGALFGPFSMGLVVAEELMKDRSASARAQSAMMLAQDPSQEAVDELKLALTDKNWAVRAAAAQALAKSPGALSLKVFETLLSDKNDAVRTIAAAGIIRRSGAAKPRNLRWPVTPTPATVTASAQ